jgi:class 3 adenylate cyclase
MLNHTSLIYANFFFTDIVGLSDPRLSTKTQIKKIGMYNREKIPTEALRLRIGIHSGPVS